MSPFSYLHQNKLTKILEIDKISATILLQYLEENRHLMSPRTAHTYIYKKVFDPDQVLAVNYP
jgi:hypothetical protein